MKWLCIACVLIACSSMNAEDMQGDNMPPTMEEVEVRLSKQVQDILDHYKQEDPVGLPHAPVPDPMPIPDMTQSFSVATMYFKNVSVYGLSKFRIVSVESDLTAMQVSVKLHIDQLDIRGQYKMSTWLSRSQGDFTVVLEDVSVIGLAKLEVQRSGQLQAQNIDMDISFRTIDMNFQNLGFMGNIFQGIINSVGSFLFDSIKPFILTEVNTNIRGDVNKHIKSIPQRFPNSISPLDMVVAEARQHVRKLGYDPYRLDDYHYNAGLLTLDTTHTWVRGISSFYRVGNMTVSMSRNVVYVVMHVGTQRLEGRSVWEVGAGGFLSRAGTAAFTVEYIHGRVNVSQPLDTRHHPTLEELDLKLGNIQARVDGAGTLDYLIEMAVNVLPNLLRYQIVNAVEGPIKRHVQEVLDKIDVEEVVREKLPEIDAAVEKSRAAA